MTTENKATKNKILTKSLALGEFPVSDMGMTQQRRELAEVLEFYPRYFTYRIKTRGAPGSPGQPAGRTLTVPRKVENPNVTAPLKNGTVVVVDWSLGFPYIDGVLHVGSSKSLVENGSGKAPKLSRKSTVLAKNDAGNIGYYVPPGMPDDAFPGDFAAMSPDGSYIAALQGKEATIYGSEKANVSVFGNEGLVRTVCDHLEQLSSLGILEIKNEGGRANLKFRAAADQLTESGGSEEQWTFHLDIGDKGDFFDLRVTKPDGSTLSRIYLSSDGRIELLGVNGVHLINAGKSPRNDVDGGDVTRQIMGKLIESVKGSITQTTQSKRVSNVSEDDQTIVGHNHGLSINNHQAVTIGGNQQVIVSGGSAVTAKPSNVAVYQHILNGSYNIDIGNPIDGASPAAMAGYNLFVHNGEVTIGQDPNPLAGPTLRALISLNTLLPNSVALGGTANPATTNPAMFHACIFEAFASLMSLMITLLDNHMHPTKWGMSGPAFSPLAGGFATALSPLVPNVQSIRVLIGA
jgi:hypothetical protein